MTCHVSRASIVSLTLLIAVSVIQTTKGGSDSLLQHSTYGVDCSFPIHYTAPRCGSLLGDRQSIYNDFMEGCKRKFGNDCDLNEYMRLSSNLEQPKSIQNQTSQGFKTIQAPELVRDYLNILWNKNKYRMKEERWPKGATAINHWASPTYVVSVEEKGLRGGSSQIQEVQNAVKEKLEEWMGTEMNNVATYGIRVHTAGSIIPPHVTRAPMMNSAIMNVAQDVDESWILEVYKRDGNAVNVTLEPGEMIMFESGSLIHGYPFPLKGRFVATMYFHFETAGHTLLKSKLAKASFAYPPSHTSQEDIQDDTQVTASRQDDAGIKQKEAHTTAKLAFQGATTETELHDGIQVTADRREDAASDPQKEHIVAESTILEGIKVGFSSKKAAQGILWDNTAPAELQAHSPSTQNSNVDSQSTSFKRFMPNPHGAAMRGDLEELAKIAANDPSSLHLKDENGWQPIHEAARYGHWKCIELLVAHGADVNSISNFGYGRSPLRIAIDFLANLKTLIYLQSVGAVDSRSSEF